MVNLFHRKTDRISRTLDENKQAQRRAWGEQDGSEVRSVRFERLIAEALTLQKRRNAFRMPSRSRRRDLCRRNQFALAPPLGLSGEPKCPDRHRDNRQPRIPQG